MIGCIQIHLLEFDRGEIPQSNLIVKVEISKDHKFYTYIFGNDSKLSETEKYFEITEENELKITVFDKTGDDFRTISTSKIPLKPIFDEQIWGKIENLISR